VPLPDPSQLTAAAQSLGAFIQRPPRVGLVLGSGLGPFADDLDDLVRVPYGQIPHFPASSVVGHAGNLCLGRVGAVPVACLQGRAHLYEGRRVDEVVFGVSLLARLGVSAVLLTNAAGGIAGTLSPGSLMLITDHLNLTGENPLQGPAVAGVPRFVDMSYAYDPELSELARRAARAVGVDLAQGVYAGLRGPNYETPAEIRMLSVLGADAVGMSTVLEVLALRGLGVRVAAVSCITNLAAGLSKTTLSHDEVGATALQTSQRFAALLSAWIGAIDASA
jgi:purine-nucleoside phosphorylase